MQCRPFSLMANWVQDAVAPAAALQLLLPLSYALKVLLLHFKQFLLLLLLLACLLPLLPLLLLLLSLFLQFLLVLQLLLLLLLST